MSRRHGRATIPFGKKYRGVRVRLCPDDYLSWLSGWLSEDEGRSQKFRWLLDSIVAELSFRGLRGDLAETIEPIPSPAEIAGEDTGRRADEIFAKMSSFIEW